VAKDKKHLRLGVEFVHCETFLQSIFLYYIINKRICKYFLKIYKNLQLVMRFYQKPDRICFPRDFVIK
jgi:hypothetical protein